MPMKIALLIVDMQVQFMDTLSRLDSFESAVEYINHVASLVRQADCPVVLVKDVEAVSKDSEAAAVISDIEVHDSDIVVCKVHSNAFWGTDLEAALRECGVGLVIVCGFATEHCVLFTYEGARERGFRAALLQNGLLSQDPEANAAALRQRHAISYPVVEFLLSSEG